MSNEIDWEIRQCAIWCSLVNLIVPVCEVFAFGMIFMGSMGLFFGLNFGRLLESPGWLLLIILLLISWLVPWKFWQLGKKKHCFIDETAKRTLNFTLSCYLYLAIVYIVWLKTYFLGAENIVPQTGGFIPNSSNWQTSTATYDQLASISSLIFFIQAFYQNKLYLHPQVLAGHFSDPPTFFGAWRPSNSDYDRQGAIVHFFMSMIERFYDYGLWLIPLLLIFHTWAIVFGSIQAAKGNVYKYPLSIRFIR